MEFAADPADLGGKRRALGLRAITQFVE